MNKLQKSFLMDWSPYSIQKTIVPNFDIKSSEFVFVSMIDAIRNNKPFCVIRMGDGEAGFMNFYKNNVKPKWLNDSWCDNMFIKDKSDNNIKRIGKELIEAANKCDFLGSSIWGSSNSSPSWNVEKFINRPITMPRCSNWINMEWIADGCAHALVSNFSFGILHSGGNETEIIMRKSLAKDPRFHNVMRESGNFKLVGNYNECEEYIKNTNFQVYLTSCGIAGKYWLYEMSRKYNKIMLDLGHGIIRSWARPNNL